MTFKQTALISSLLAVMPFISHAHEHKTAIEKGIIVVPYQAPVTQEVSLSSSFEQRAVTQVANHVANWQLSQFDIRSNMMRPEGRASGIPEGWMYATFDIGLLAWAEKSQQANYHQAVTNLSKLNDWKLGPRVYHADDHAIGTVYLDLYQHSGGGEKIAHTINTFDHVLAKPFTTDLHFDDDDKIKQISNGRTFTDPACTVRWCWADAFFMAPPVWAQLAEVTGNQAYLDFMDKEFWVTTEYLFNKEEQLFLRDSRYFTRKDSKDRLIYWGRGNGWVLAGIARVLAHMPESYEKKSEYVELFKAVSNRVIALQQADGSWPSSLLEVETNSTPESSGTGLLVFALAWGVNAGVLDKETTLPVIQKGWVSLVDSVQPNGKLGWVQQVAFAPGSANANDTQLYGTGALLLAASEIISLTQASSK